MNKFSNNNTIETSFIQIRKFKPSKLKIAFPKKIRINSKIIPSVFVYDVFEMFKTFVKLHILRILRMIKNVLRIVSYFRLLCDVHTNIQECFTNGTELFQLMRNILSNDLEIIQNVKFCNDQ